MSGVHKGIDIFAMEGTPVLASTAGVVVWTGESSRGGNVVLVLGPKWRLHYYAHLKGIQASSMAWISKGIQIGKVGTSGNARGGAPHLHYSVVSLIPHPWRLTREHQGWKKMFYLDPSELLRE